MILLEMIILFKIKIMSGDIIAMIKKYSDMIKIMMR